MSYWFRPKYYGYGATPSNWKGWLATLVFLITAIAITQALPLLLSIISLVIATVLFCWLAWKKTEGTWRWRWGADAQEK